MMPDVMSAIGQDDRYLLVRAGALYVALVLTVVSWACRRPRACVIGGAALAGLWNVPVLLALHLLATRAGWWWFDADGGLLLGMPVDLLLVWAWLWGVIPALAFSSWPISRVALIALAVDLVLMPAAAPVLTLGPTWLAGEAIGLLAGLVPGQLLARWTLRDERLVPRAVLQVIAFGGLLVFVLPAIAIDASGGAWLNPFSRPTWQLSLLIQAAAVPALIGLTAVQEFVERGGGTPVPFDPPRRLVTTGIYAYVRNPMQLSALLLLVVMGGVLHNIWIAAAGVMAHLYSVGFAGWDEDEDVRARSGDDWAIYRRGVRRWVPRIRPWSRGDTPPGRLFVAGGCDMCREVGRWFERHHATHLVTLPAETHPSGALTRVTYEPSDGTRAASGIEAIARALEHIHLGWALVGFFLRIPVIRPLVQILADACGAEPRRLPASPMGVRGGGPDTCARRSGYTTPAQPRQ